MQNLKEQLDRENCLLLDGAMGTMLIELGLEPGTAPESWNVTQPEKVRSVHRAYIAAGSRVVLTNSFGGSRIRLERHGLGGQAVSLNRAAAENARAEAEAAGHRVLVGGSIGPTGEMLAPLGELSFEDAKAAFTEQAAALAAGGADLIWIETMSDLQEVRAAVEGAREATDLPIAATMSFDTRGRTMMGVRPEQAVEALTELDLYVIGANCGTGPEELEEVIEKMHRIRPEAILVAKANAGLPHMTPDGIVYDGTPARMADYALRARDLGARLIGACCGSTPAHIRAMAEALECGRPAEQT